MRPTTGLTLGNRYRLVRRIAVGGMGEVWVANDQALEREVAVKVLREEYAGNEDFLNRLRTEARNSAALSHPNIAQMYDYGEQQSSGYLVMELVVGEPMADLLEREPVLPPARLLPILAQTARGLHAAHLAGVVHRDVKPGNILLDRAGTVKITDFGVSLAANQVPMTAAGMVMGTAQYLSPEQAIGQAATGASDVYALGIVAYEAVVGNRPFTGSTPVDIAVAHVNEAVPPLPSSVHRGLAALVMAMLEKDPARRPGSADDVARALDELARAIEHDPFGTAARPAGRRARRAAEQAAARAVPTSLAIPESVRRTGLTGATPVVPAHGTPAGDDVTARTAQQPVVGHDGPGRHGAPAPAGPAGADSPWHEALRASVERADVAADRHDAGALTDGSALTDGGALTDGAATGEPGAPGPGPALPWERVRTETPRAYPPRREVQTSRTRRPASPVPAAAPARETVAAASTRAERRRTAERAPRRTSTTTGLRIPALKNISWPLLALLGLLVVVLLATLLRPSGGDDDASAARTADPLGPPPAVVVTATSGVTASDDGMILRNEPCADVRPALTSKDV